MQSPTDDTENKLILKSPLNPKLSSETGLQQNRTQEEPAKDSLPVSLIKPRLRLKQPLSNADHAQTPINNNYSIKIKGSRSYGSSEHESQNEKSTLPNHAHRKQRGYEEGDAPTEEHIILQIKCPDAAQKLRERLMGEGPQESVKLLFSDQRNASFFIDDEKFKATLYDLPCIIESQKAYDTKQFNKVADICQTLIVERIAEQSPKEANEDHNVVDCTPTDSPHEPPLPEPNTGPSKQQDYLWPHGITPPLWNVRNRRFRKRPISSTVEEIESNIIRLLKADNEADETFFEVHNVKEDPPKKKIYVESDDIPELPDESDELDLELDGDNNPDEKLIDPIDAAIEEALEEQETLATADLDTQKPDTSDDALGGSPNAYEDKLGHSGEEGSFIKINYGQDESVGEEQKKRLLEDLDFLKAEIEPLEKKILDYQHRLSGQINPIMKNRFNEIINRINLEISEKKDQIEHINKSLLAFN